MGRNFAIPGTTSVVLLLALCGIQNVHARAGDHIRSGNATITPSLELQVLTRSNVYLAEGTTTAPSGETIGAPVERFSDATGKIDELNG